MAKPSVLVLYNQPLLPRDHADAESEYQVVGVAELMDRTLRNAGWTVRSLGLGRDPTVLWRELQEQRPDVVFNLFEGNVGNTETESYVAGLLDWAGVPYTGCPVATLSLARSKHITKYLLKGAGLPTADFQVVHFSGVREPRWASAFPVIVKPATQDASIGVDQQSVCTSQEQLADRVQHVFKKYGGPVLIEEYISGRELNVALIELPQLRALRPMEVVFPDAGWPIYTYGCKWNAGTAEYEQTRTRPASDLSAAMVAELNRLAMSAYLLLGCRDYARVDFRMNPGGQAYILEVNPNPDISADADLTASLDCVQLTHADFIVRLAERAFARRHIEKI
jgi:D-alanine-D-alanine ligase